MSRVVRWLDERFYPDTQPNWDNTRFAEAVRRHLQPHHTVLDLGAGIGRIHHMGFKGEVARLCGVDLDPRVLDNPLLDEAKIGSGEELPYDDETFDVVFSDNVIEHLTQPDLVFRDVARVLRPGGIFLVKTPNFRHYMPLIAHATPLWFHRAYTRVLGRDSEDTFPTTYLANTPGTLRRLARGAGLELEDHHLIEDRPEYLRVSALTYPAGIVYERLVNRSERLAPLRLILIGEMRKPAA